MKYFSPASGHAAILALAVSTIPALASPTPNLPSEAVNTDSENQTKRQVDLEDLHPRDRCTWTTEWDLTEDDLGYMVCENPDVTWGTPDIYECDECFGVDGYDEPLKSGPQVQCNIVSNTAYGGGTRKPYLERTACPGDDVPEEDPDGNPSKDLHEGVLDAWCGAAGNSGLGGFANMAACYGWAFSKGGNTLEQNKIGATLMCDSVFLGMCSAFGGL